MTKKIPRELFQKGFIREDQFNKIDAITSGKIVSVFYELQAMLYLGVLLFTTGVGILIYLNIGSIGHIVAIFGLIVLTIGCFYYAYKNGPAYSDEAVKPISPYFDYVVLLGALVFVAVFGYLQFQFGFFDDNFRLATLVTSIFLFFVAYRFDHIGVLSMAVTALISFASVGILFERWYRMGMQDGGDLHLVAIGLGVLLATVGLVLDWRRVKTHFTFTYLNFSLLLFFVGSIWGMFANNWWAVFLLLIYGGLAFVFVTAKKKKYLLFFLYAFVSAYIGTTIFFARINFFDFFGWIFYCIFSLGGFIFLIIRSKSYFKQS